MPWPSSGANDAGDARRSIVESLSERACCRGAACCACGRQAANVDRSIAWEFAVVIEPPWTNGFAGRLRPTTLDEQGLSRWILRGAPAVRCQDLPRDHIRIAAGEK